VAKFKKQIKVIASKVLNSEAKEGRTKRFTLTQNGLANGKREKWSFNLSTWDKGGKCLIKGQEGTRQLKVIITI